MTNDKTELYPPLTAFYNRLRAIMEKDPDIEMDLDYENSLIIINIANSPKAAAWREILPETKVIGETKFDIKIYVTKQGVDENVINVALTGNPSFSRLKHVVNPKLAIDRWFCYMNPDVIQFNNDNFGSPESLETRTAEDLAREVFRLEGISICTEPID